MDESDEDDEETTMVIMPTTTKKQTDIRISQEHKDNTNITTNRNK